MYRFFHHPLQHNCSFLSAPFFFHLSHRLCNARRIGGAAICIFYHAARLAVKGFGRKKPSACKFSIEISGL